MWYSFVIVVLVCLFLYRLILYDDTVSYDTIFVLFGQKIGDPSGIRTSDLRLQNHQTNHYAKLQPVLFFHQGVLYSWHPFDTKWYSFCTHLDPRFHTKIVLYIDTIMESYDTQLQYSICQRRKSIVFVFFVFVKSIIWYFPDTLFEIVSINSITNSIADY